jgi:DNA-binding transcriptional LysR family regulator
VGVGYVFEDTVDSLIEAGALVRVLKDWTPPFAGFFLYYPSRRQISPALAAFVEAIRFRRAKKKAA